MDSLGFERSSKREYESTKWVFQVGFRILVYNNHKSIDEKKKSDDSETAGEAAEKKVLVLGLENSGKSTFLAALAQHDSPVTSEREDSQPTQGFHVVCVSTRGVSLNVWESK